ncbi:MAG: hypothetical protein M3Q29_02390, partial [Chloroflexota bacterium]|nr:hypothetical protein [Chloroflexota bacterium]
MKTITSMLAALMLLLVMATPGLAGGGDTGDDTVTKTFELTLSGDIPETQIFAGFVATRELIETGEGQFVLILFCGDVPDEDLEEVEQEPSVELVVVSSEACEGGEGTEYNADVELERGAEIAFVIFRADLENEEDFEVIAESGLDEEGNPTEFETIEEDTTNPISCNFENGSCGNDQGDDDQQVPGMMPDNAMDMIGGGETPDMPNTGAGGMASGGAP